jgi:hypothetical protein
MRGIGQRKPLPAVTAAPKKQIYDDCFRCGRLLPWIVTPEAASRFWELIVGRHPDGAVCGRCSDEMDMLEWNLVGFGTTTP